MSVPPLAFAGRGCQAAGRADGWLSGRLPAGWPPAYRMDKKSFDDISQSVAVLLHNWRFLRQDQIVALLELNHDVQTILDNLVAADIVRRFNNPLSASPTESIYALGKRGAALAASTLGSDRAHLLRSAQRSAVKPLFLDHLLHINDIRLAFHLSASGQPGHNLAVWLDDRQVADRLPDAGQPGGWLPVRPDGYLVYQTPARQLHAFVESDLGTVTNKRWAVRVQAYVGYRLCGAFRQRYGISSFRVLMVTTTARRLNNLLRTTEKAGGKSLFWFTTWTDLAAYSPLSAIWSVAGGGASAIDASSGASSPASSREKRGNTSRGPPGGEDGRAIACRCGR